MFRKQKMLSIEEIAGMVGVSQNEIKDMEKGKYDPRLSAIFLISGVLDVSPEDLLTLPDRNDNQHYALRYQILKLLNDMSNDEMKKLIELINSKNVASGFIPDV